MDRNHLNNFERGSTKDHSCKIWSKSNQWFRRRCCLKIVNGRTDRRTTTTTPTTTTTTTDGEWSQYLTLSLWLRWAKKVLPNSHRDLKLKKKYLMNFCTTIIQIKLIWILHSPSERSEQGKKYNFLTVFITFLGLKSKNSRAFWRKVRVESREGSKSEKYRFFHENTGFL